MTGQRFSGIVFISAFLAFGATACGGDPITQPGGGEGKAQISTTSIDFGYVDCGGAAVREASVRNVGTGTLTFVASVSSERFEVTPAEGSLGPGEEATLAVTAKFPGSVEAATVEEAVLTMTTSDVDNETVSVSLKSESAGVTLRLEPGLAALGEVPLGTNAPPLPLKISNTGNVAATIAFLQPSDTQFWLDWTGAPSLVTVSAGETFDGLWGMFSPRVFEASSASAGLKVAQASCGASASELPMSGQGTSWPPGTVAFEPNQLDFGEVDCGTTASPQTVTFTNAGELDYTLSAVLERGEQSPYTLEVQPKSGLVVAGGQLTITVTPAGIPQTSSVAPGFYNDTLIVLTDVPNEELHEIEIAQTARGAIFSISATKLNFGSVPVGAKGAAQFSVGNLGNAPGKLFFSIDELDPFFLPEIEIAGGASAVVTGKFTPLVVSSFSSLASIGAGATTVLCQPLARTELELSGFGIDDAVVAVSTSSLTFGAGGMVGCGSQAPPQTFTLRSYSDESVGIDYAFGRGEESPFSVIGTDIMGPNGNTTITVTPKPIPAVASTRPDAFGDTLSIHAVGATFEETYVVNLFQTAQGAVFSFVPGTLSLANSGLFGANAQTKSFSVRNDGNILASFRLSKAGSHENRFTVTPETGTAGAGGSATGSVTLAGRSGSGRSAEVVLTSTDTLCAPSPVVMQLKGN